MAIVELVIDDIILENYDLEISHDEFIDKMLEKIISNINETQLDKLFDYEDQIVVDMIKLYIEFTGIFPKAGYVDFNSNKLFRNNSKYNKLIDRFSRVVIFDNLAKYEIISKHKKIHPLILKKLNKGEYIETKHFFINNTHIKIKNNSMMC